MLELMSNIAPLGFERFSPLVNPLEVAPPPPFGNIRASREVEQTAAVAAPRLESRGAGAARPEIRHPLPAAAWRKAQGLQSVPVGIALFSPAAARVLLEAQAASGW